MGVPNDTPAPLSNPLGELVGEGSNSKYVKECTELHLGDKGFEKLAGFERLINLEVLWVNGNKLTSVSGLDDNFRIRRLYAMDNKISTLKGSLRKFVFLELLDLTNNNLRNLAKLLSTLTHFKFLRYLELRGNPCCEEPDYRLQVIHAVPSLHVLDLHVVTPAERTCAEELFGKGAERVAASIAFRQHAPPKPPVEKPERGLEKDLEKSVALLTMCRTQEIAAAEAAMFTEEVVEDKPVALPLPPNYIPGKPPPEPKAPPPLVAKPVRAHKDVVRLTTYTQAKASGKDDGVPVDLSDLTPTIHVDRVKLAALQERKNKSMPLEDVSPYTVKL